MYPLHLNYTTTLPCKTITMKITIFIIVLVLKSNENMEIWHFKLSRLADCLKPYKNSLFQDIFKVSAPRFHTSSLEVFLVFIKLSTALLMKFCGRSSHIVCKTFFGSSMVLLLLYMSIIMAALSHYCCRTTLQCQCHVSQATRHVRESIHKETLPKQHSFQF